MWKLLKKMRNRTDKLSHLFQPLSEETLSLLHNCQKIDPCFSAWTGLQKTLRAIDCPTNTLGQQPLSLSKVENVFRLFFFSHFLHNRKKKYNRRNVARTGFLCEKIGDSDRNSELTNSKTKQENSPTGSFY